MEKIIRVLNRQILVFIIFGCGVYAAIDKPKAHHTRSRYLLGIFYNEQLKNYKDGIVYFDYMSQVEPNNPAHQANKKYCEGKLKTN